MTESIPFPAALRVLRVPESALENPAVAQCVDAWHRAFQEEMKEYEDENGSQAEEGSFPEVFAGRAADKAYREAMPPLSGHQNILDFIACTAHGMLIEAINENACAKLIYAAQVALSASPRQFEKREPAVPSK